MHESGDSFDPVRPVVHCVHSRHDCQECLCSTNIRCRFFAPDVLLTGLQGHPICAPPVGIDWNADDPPRHDADVFLTCCKIPRMRPAKSHGHPETLRVADDHVCTEFSRRLEKGKTQEVCRNSNQSSGLMESFDELRVVRNHSVLRGILK